MNNTMKKILYIGLVLLFGVVTSCKDSFLEKPPLGQVGEDQLASASGVDALLVAAYSVLDGVNGITTWDAAPYVYGSIPSDDAYKGTDEGDQIPQTNIERYVGTPQEGYFNQKWRVEYDGVSRCNDVIRVAAKALEAGTMSQSEHDQAVAEARALRAYYHFEVKIVFGNVPFIDETVGTAEGIPFTEAGNVDESGNYIDIWPNIEQDLQDAIGVLPTSNSQPGRFTRWTAQALLAKVYMHWNGRAAAGIDPTTAPGYGAAKTLLDGIIAGPFSLVDNYHDNYRIEGNNNDESILEIQASVNDGSNGENGNYRDVLNFPYGSTGPGTCCGFHQASQNLVNAFLTDPATGLPYLDDFNSQDFRWDQGIAADADWQTDVWVDDDFIPYGRDVAAESIDPRLDWTLGRRGIPYLDWALHPGDPWIRKQGYGGPYSPKKQVFYKAEQGSLSTASGWAQGASANNTREIRLAHVMLWRAEIAVEESDLSTALSLVNQIRDRADNAVVMARLADGTETTVPACVGYNVQQYTGFPSQDYARQAVRHETRVEFGMEGNRFFDLLRWGVAPQVLNDYVAVESTRPQGSNVNANVRSYLVGVTFADKNLRWPIPQDQLDIINNTDVLKQNPGY
jgi:hypothetical protein